MQKTMKYQEETQKDFIDNVVAKILAAARTAPKARGIDRLCIAVASNQEIQAIAQEMTRIAQNNGPAFFERDAQNIIQADAVIFIGTKYESQGLQLCGYCGFENCEKKNQHPDVPCVFNTGDLGIAVGSAVSIVMDNRVDNRILYSAGYVAVKMNLLPPEVKLAYAIPLSVSSKNPFFDRKF